MFNLTLATMLRSSRYLLCCLALGATGCAIAPGEPGDPGQDPTTPQEPGSAAPATPEPTGEAKQPLSCSTESDGSVTMCCHRGYCCFWDNVNGGSPLCG